MKQKDLALIIVIAIIGAIVAFVVTRQMLGTPEKNRVKVEVVRKISPTFPKADKNYFNSNSINPTRIINIDKNDNQNPFNSQKAR